jgi:cobalamin-dependent methionine synthase I
LKNNYFILNLKLLINSLEIVNVIFMFAINALKISGLLTESTDSGKINKKK